MKMRPVDVLNNLRGWVLWPQSYHLSEDEAKTCIKALERQKTEEWIPIEWHNITEEERKREGYPEEWLTHMDCVMPDDGQEILITTKNGQVEKDICYRDDYLSLDSGYDWIDDVAAWRPLPEPYKTNEEGG